MNDQKPVLSDDMMQALRRSGYLMESRVGRVIRRHDWLVDSNRYIPDASTGTARESDLVAERSYDIDKERFHMFHNEVVIECINNDSPLVFLSRAPENPAVISQLFCMGGFPRTIDISQGRGDDKDNSVSLHAFLGLDHAHRYFQLPTYDMYCSFTPRKREQRKEKGYWLAEQPKDFYESFCKVIQVREYYQDLHEGRLLRDGPDEAEPRIRIIQYHQVMVFKGPLVALDQPDALLESGDGGEACKQVSHLLYRRSEGDDRGVSSTLVDVITEDYVPQFLALLDREAQHFCGILAGKVDQLLPRIKPDRNLASYLWYTRNHPDSAIGA
jgi:hypothetical protein